MAPRSPRVSARIADDLRTAIRAGDYWPGQKLPSSNMLAEQYGTTRATAEKAVERLKMEGLVRAEQGKGTFVNPAPPVLLTNTAASYWARRETGESNWNAEVRAQGRTPEQRIIEVTFVPAPAYVATRLGLDEGTRVFVRRRLFLADGHPMQFSDGYYPAGLVQDTKIIRPSPIRGGVHAELERVAGRPLRFVEELEARLPDQEERRQLQLSEGIPVVRTLRTLYVTGERPVEVLEELRPADRNRFRYEIDLGPPA